MKMIINEKSVDVFTKTGFNLVEISSGYDAPIVVDDELITASKHIGTFTEQCINVDVPELDGSCGVSVDYEMDADWNYIHFSYDGGTGYTIRTPRYVNNQGEIK
jgi:hypothetical protein